MPVPLRMMRPGLVSTSVESLVNTATHLDGLGGKVNFLVTDSAPKLDSLQSDVLVLASHTVERQLYWSVSLSRLSTASDEK